MLSEQRYKEILDILEKEGTVKTTTLCARFQTSRETIRRDLEALEAKGLIQRIHGGAMKMESYAAFRVRKGAHPLYKEEIADEAVRYIHEGEVIALDSGTTSLALARAIKNKFHDLTVVTNSLAVANELSEAEGITLVVTGGVYRADEEAFVSDIAALIFSMISVDIFFLTTCGISIERGVTYQRMDEVSVQNKMMEAADRTIVIADSSKLGTNSLVRMCGIEKISLIITDSNVTQDQINAFERVGVRVAVSKGRGEKNELFAG